jgi:UDP-3-O-[3-hydroxymyristoyl] glucosamine N-acyltransferase
MAFATVSAKASVGAHTVLYPGVYVGENAMIGDDCILYPNTVVADSCVLGDRVILQPGAVIGGDGFGFAPDNGKYLKIPQVGNVVLEDDVEIGANTTVDRAVMGSTKVGRGTKLDNLIQVAHNCQIGEHTVMAAMTGLAGSCNIVVIACSGVMSASPVTSPSGQSDLGYPHRRHGGHPRAGRVLGFPSAPMKEEMKRVALYRDLPDLAKRLRKVEKALERLDPTLKDSKPPKAEP